MIQLINRPKYTERIAPFINKNIIKVLTGQRRVGKKYKGKKNKSSQAYGSHMLVNLISSRTPKINLFLNNHFLAIGDVNARMKGRHQICVAHFHTCQCVDVTTTA